MRLLRVGVVGYCPPTVFNTVKAAQLIASTFDEIVRLHPAHRIMIVSGLANLGVPGLAYNEAFRRGWLTAGVVCIRRALKYPPFPVTETLVVYDESQESATFLAGLDGLLRFGGGTQSLNEAAAARASGIFTLEHELATQ